MSRAAATKEALAQAYTNAGKWASLHATDPGDTGAGEVSGGSYARQLITWDFGGSDGVVTSEPITFSVPAGHVVAVGLWTAGSGESHYVDSVQTDVQFDSPGTYTFTLSYTQH